MVLRRFFEENVEAPKRIEPLEVEEVDQVGFPCYDNIYFVTFKKGYGIFGMTPWSSLAVWKRVFYAYFVKLAERWHTEWFRERLLKDRKRNRVFTYLSLDTPYGYTAWLSDELLSEVRLRGDIASIYHFTYVPVALPDVSTDGKPLAKLLLHHKEVGTIMPDFYTVCLKWSTPDESAEAHFEWLEAKLIIDKRSKLLERAQDLHSYGGKFSDELVQDIRACDIVEFVSVVVGGYLEDSCPLTNVNLRSTTDKEKFWWFWPWE
jgi:hypothetical protein